MKVNRKKSTELLRLSEIVSDKVFQWQLTSLKQAVQENGPEWYNSNNKQILSHDNAQSHTASVVKTYLKIHDWEVLSHPLYSTYIDPSDRYLFRSMRPALQGVRFTSFESI